MVNDFNFYKKSSDQRKEALKALKDLHKKSLDGDVSSPINSAMLWYMREYGLINDEEFGYINRG